MLLILIKCQTLTGCFLSMYLNIAMFCETCKCGTLKSKIIEVLMDMNEILGVPDVDILFVQSKYYS